MRTRHLVDPHGRTWHVRVPTRRRERVRGLIASRELRPLDALLLRTRSIHTVGMRRSIDAVLLDGGLRVLDVITLRPGRVLLPRRGVRWILETPAGSGLRRGDRLSRPVPSRRC